MAAIAAAAPASAGAALNEAPVITAPREVWAERGAVYRAAGAISVADLDAGTGELSVRLTAPPDWGGGFTLPETTGLTFTVGDGTEDVLVEFRGTLTAVNAALAQLEYRESGYWVAGHATLKIDVDDLGNTGDGGPRTASAAVGYSIGRSGPIITVPYENPPHTPRNTPYLSNGELFWIEDAQGDEIDVRIHIANATIQLGAAPDADVVDEGGDRDARVIGTPEEIAPAIHGIVVTPDLDFVGSAMGEVLARDRDRLAGSSFGLIVDPEGPAAPPSEEPRRQDQRVGDEQLQPTPRVADPRPQDTTPTPTPSTAPGPVARASVRRNRGVVILNAKRSSSHGKQIRSYRWTGRDGRVLSRKRTLRLRVTKPTRVTLTVTDSTGATAKTSVLVRSRANQSRRARG